MATRARAVSGLVRDLVNFGGNLEILERLRECLRGPNFSLTSDGSLRVDCSEYEYQRLPVAVLHASSLIVVDGQIFKERAAPISAVLPVLSALERICSDSFPV
jgi:hypothetical protein